MLRKDSHTHTHTPLMYMNTRRKRSQPCFAQGASGSLELAPGLHIEIAYLLNYVTKTIQFIMCGIKLSRPSI